jgi:hypothetical protein
MTPFVLFDAIELSTSITLTGGETAAAGTPGTIVEVLSGGEAYMVELFGGWVKASTSGALISVDPTDPDAFTQTIGLEVLHPQQIRLVKSAAEVVGSRSQLLTTLDELPDALVAEVVDFAEFLRQKHQQQT